MKEINICAIDGVIHISTEEFERVVADIREDAIDEFVELYEKFCNSNIVCSSNDCIGKFCPKCFRDNFMEQFKEQK